MHFRSLWHTTARKALKTEESCSDKNVGKTLQFKENEMSAFAWKDDFRTGIEEMDKHHKKSFDYLTQLEQAAGGNKG